MQQQSGTLEVQGLCRTPSLHLRYQQIDDRCSKMTTQLM